MVSVLQKLSLIREDKTHTCNFNKGRKWVIETEIPWKDNNELQKIDILALKSQIARCIFTKKKNKAFVEELSELIFDTTTFFSSYFLKYWAPPSPWKDM